KKREGWDQRVGHVESMLKSDVVDPGAQVTNKPRVLLHAVSVGEVNALRSIVPELSQCSHVIVSTTTDTGLAHAQGLFSEFDSCDVVRYPLDCSWMVRRFLDIVRPDVVGLVELEVWPNFVKACSKRKIPIGIINGRLSARSFKGYKKIRMLLKPTFRRLKFACVQDQDYADRIEQMGVIQDRILITGSMKWDSIDASLLRDPSERAVKIAMEMGVDLDQPIVVAGSTGPGEEALLHDAISNDVQLIIAPRKTDRFEEAVKSVPGCVRRSSRQTVLGSKRFLLDTIGELSAIYEIADLVIVGRSFFDLYGSDPIEPAALGKCVLIGPAHSDFQQAMQLLERGAGIQVVDSQALGDEVARLLIHEDIRHEMGSRARACVIDQQGASKKHIAILFEQIHAKFG
ncbi:MAG: glycosyltransferase N-terminal domain-containing protein, partial [Phycisphaerales bacterium]|nr:glycosyltransferase N-terminal domain-containing protein [Phycisphaerales bacterium]